MPAGDCGTCRMKQKLFPGTNGLGKFLIYLALFARLSARKA
jgi:hypothetical protein